MELKFAMSLALLGQILMAVLYSKEALLNKAGSFCWLKCTAATLLFGSLGSVLAWGLYVLSIDDCPPGW